MISLSKVIKSHDTSSESKRKKVIGVRQLSGGQEMNGAPDTQENEAFTQDAKVEAEQMLQQARNEAEAILEEARNQAQETYQQIEQDQLNWESEKQQWIEQAQEQGYEAGFNQGSQDGYEQYRTVIEEARQVVSAARLDYEKHIEDSEYTILHLGMKAAEKVLGTKLEEEPDYYLHLVKRAIREVKDHENIQIQVHPTEYEMLLTHKDELLALFTVPTAELYIYPNDEMQQYQCVIESSFGRIDASIDSQLTEIKLKLLQVLEEAHEYEGN